MTEKETKCCCCNRKKERSEQEYKDLINRLSRIEGQIRGIKRMLDEDCYALTSSHRWRPQMLRSTASISPFGNHIRRVWQMT